MKPTRREILAVVILCTTLQSGHMRGGESQECGWFRVWSERMEIRRFHTEFVVYRKDSDESAPEQRGTWSTRIAPSLAQRLEILKLTGDHEALYEAHSWDLQSGEGRSFRREARSVRGTGTLSPSRPTEFGKADVPSNMFFLFPRERPLRDLISECDIAPGVVDDKYDALHFAWGSTLLVYILDRSNEQPIRELRTYVKKRPPVPVRNTELGQPIPLPAGFAGAHLFVNLVVRESATVDLYQLPVEWEVRHSVRDADETRVVRLDPSSIRLDGPEPAQGYAVEWPPGTEVYDSARVERFYAGENGEKVHAELISEHDLDAILTSAGVSVGTGGTTEWKARPRVTGCAANAIYVVCHLVGRPCSLSTVVRDLGITAADPFSSLQEVVRVATNLGVRAMPVEGTRQLLEVEEGSPVLVHVVRKDGRGNHFAVIDAFEHETGTVRVFDPPMKSYRATVDDVCQWWTGKAAVFGDAEVARVRQQAILEMRTRYLWIAAVVCLSGLGVLGMRTWRKNPL